MAIVPPVAFTSGLNPSSGEEASIMPSNTEFSVIDGKLVKEDEEEANFEENLTFEE